MYNTSQDLLDAFRATSDTLHGLLRGHTHEQAVVARGGDENWSVVEVVCHLRDAEERALERTRLMRDTTDPWLAGYDQEQLAKERNYAATPLDAAVATFLQLRTIHIAELAVLSPQDWERPGEHEEQGAITLGSHILHLVSHDAVHLAQIARQLEQVQ
jgi:hypothetical protein